LAKFKIDSSGDLLVGCYYPARIFALQEATMRFVSKLLRDENGATAIEYGLIAALISVVIIAAITLVGSQLSGVFGSIASALSAAS
jgi:pilus assembly protein Flp/PilA